MGELGKDNQPEKGCIPCLSYQEQRNKSKYTFSLIRKRFIKKQYPAVQKLRTFSIGFLMSKTVDWLMHNSNFTQVLHIFCFMCIDLI